MQDDDGIVIDDLPDFEFGKEPRRKKQKKKARKAPSKNFRVYARQL